MTEVVEIDRTLPLILSHVSFFTEDFIHSVFLTFFVFAFLVIVSPLFVESWCDFQVS